MFCTVIYPGHIMVSLTVAACTHAVLLAVNSCTGLGVNMPSYMNPAQIGALAQLLNGSQAQPPALAPMPVLNSSDVTEPPFPSAAPKNAPGGAANGSTPAPGASPSGSQAAAVMRAGILPMVTALFASLLIWADILSWSCVIGCSEFSYHTFHWIGKAIYCLSMLCC